MPRPEYVIDSSGDLVLWVVELDYSVIDKNKCHPIKDTARMRVSSGKISEHTNILRIAPRNKNSSPIIHDESIAAVELWMHRFHGRQPNYNVDIKDVWAAIRFGHKYLNDRKIGVEVASREYRLKPAKDMSMLRNWFEKWYMLWIFHRDDPEIKVENLREKELWQLLNPAYWFDCGKLFGEITKALVYKSTGPCRGDWYNPTDFRDEHMKGVPGPILRQLQAARGNLRLKIHRGLYLSPKTYILCHNQECIEVLTYSFTKSLIDSGSFPVNSEQNRKKSVNELVSCMRKFKYTIVKIEAPQNNEEVDDSKVKKEDAAAKTSEVSNPDKDDASKPPPSTQEQGHQQPKFSSQKAVHGLADEIEKKFDGLCLDCMHKFKTGDEHSDYWEHGRLYEFDRGCRFKHGQPTWYFSYMGRREIMSKFQDGISKATRKRRG
ncbi:hypothetical protein F4779DRAFT_639098 [Xylariaceae sp. FL0662B]|nr:hypothetical protein F4779DRAFT_639098 [Xylariaceae sp. FL0662B]